MKEDIVKLIEDVLGIKTVMINVDNSKIDSILKQNIIRVNTSNMIADARRIAKQITADDVDEITTNVRNVGIMLGNVIMFDDEDAKAVGINDVICLANALEKSRVQFNQIAIKQRNRLQNIIADLKAEQENNAGADNDIDEDLTKLTKEELIARLREKSK